MSKSSQVIFRCESCGRGHRWKKRLAGKKAKCPCGHIMRVPELPAEAVARWQPSKPERKSDHWEELDEQHTEPAIVRPQTGGWRFWVLAGVLVGGFSILDVFFHDRLMSLAGVVLAALLVMIGVWTRPEPGKKAR
jgi:hypothetical protein